MYQKLKEQDGKDFSACILEYDKRFSVYGEEFIFYDYNHPLNLPENLLPHSFDIVIADPPYLSEECLQKTAETIKYLTKGKILLCTGIIDKNIRSPLSTLFSLSKDKLIQVRKILNNTNLSLIQGGICILHFLLKYFSSTFILNWRHVFFNSGSQYFFHMALWVLLNFWRITRSSCKVPEIFFFLVKGPLSIIAMIAIASGYDEHRCNLLLMSYSITLQICDFF